MEKHELRKELEIKALQKLIQDVKSQHFADILSILKSVPIDYLIEYLQCDPNFEVTKNPYYFKMVRKLEQYGIPEQVLITYKDHNFIIVSKTETGIVVDVMTPDRPMISVPFDDVNNHIEEKIQNI